ncbi:MAG: hypothetical protein ACLP0B_21485 [Steroidobacteraceae bacterium]|jgi:hypothetical protein
MKLPAFYLDCVVALGHEIGPGQIDWSGTATLYGEVLKRESERYQYIPWLVTCRHLLLKDDRVTSEDHLAIRLNTKSGAPRDFSLLLEIDGKRIWEGHPNHDVDIAVLQINGPALKELDISEVYLQSDAHC